MTSLDVAGLVEDGHRFMGDPEFRQEHEDDFYARLHAADPVLPIGGGYWLLSGHKEMEAALRDLRFSLSANVEHAFAVLDSSDEEAVRHAGTCMKTMMLATDPPVHTRLRKFVRPPFLPRAINRLRPTLERICDELASALPRDTEVDLKEHFALPMPARVICEILGVPYEDHKQWEHWTEEIVKMDRTGHGDPEAMKPALDAHVAFVGYVEDLIHERRAHPGDDLFSELVTAHDDGDRLTDEELIGNFVLLIAAGHETTVNSTASGVALLLSNRTQWDKLVGDPSLAESAVNEVLRLESAPRFGNPRVAVEDVELGGHVIPAGERVVPLFNAASRDPRVFADPTTCDITRDPNPHIGFSTGQHFCLGIHLARLEMVVALETLVRRFPHMELAVDHSELRRLPAPQLRGWESVPVRLG